MNDAPKAPAAAAGAFDAAAWREKLLALNPWARGLTIDEDDETFAAARQAATLERYAQGREAWNAWADATLTLRKALEDAGRWAAKRTYSFSPLDGENEESRAWLGLASAVFSRQTSKHTFDGAAQFAAFRFPADAWFDGATFSDAAWFDGATFEGGTYLNNVRFNGPVDLSQARFEGPVTLDRSIFCKDASFSAIDSEAAFSLADATFHKVPNFIGATFKGTLRLDNVTTPRYRSTLGWTPDRNASAHFRELKRQAVEAQDRDRELEFFAQEIRTARFHASVVIPTWKTESAKQSATIRLGGARVQLPHWVRVPLPPKLPKFWSWRFSFGLAYGTFSNFGRSFLRPLIVWLALIAGFAVFYLGQHEGQHTARKALIQNELKGTKPNAGAWIAAYVASARAAWANPPKCMAPEAPLMAKTDIVREALFLSASNALVVFNIGRGDASRRTYGCLYGFEHGGSQAPPIVPYRVAVASTLQTLASAVLIFLFILAVRNLLRLK